MDTLAGVYTLVCSCTHAGIATREYLADIINRLQAGFPLRRINDLVLSAWRPRATNESEAGSQ